jgi:phosphohistidine phosphatase
MEIYLVRHGATHTKEVDLERHLNKDGLGQCQLSGRALRRLGTRFDLVISSPKVRARQTAIPQTMHIAIASVSFPSLLHI